jgi:DNA-binding transcriptional ArsR family regulator
MAQSKSGLFDARSKNVARFAKALAHPARVAILEYLMKHHGSNCGDIVNALPLAQSTVSQHLRELKSAGLIHGTADGAAMAYEIDPENWDEARFTIENLFNHNREVVAVFRRKN